MWEKLLASLLSTFIPASVIHSNDFPQQHQHFLNIEKPAIRIQHIQPQVMAQSSLVYELSSSEILFSKNAEERLPIASLTKLMVALVVSENMKLDAVVSVSNTASQAQGAQMGIEPGELYRVEDLLKGLLIPSGNDASIALAEAASGSEEAFVQLMNERAESLGLRNTRFQNTAGFDHPDHYSSALDLSRIVSIIFHRPDIIRIMASREGFVTPLNANRKLHLKSTNTLLEHPEYASIILGGKTGTTSLAGQCLVEVIENKHGKKIAFIVLGSRDRYGEIEHLIRWHNASFTW